MQIWRPFANRHSVRRMPIEISSLVAALRPDKTVLLFGAGSSLPSNAPSVQSLQSHFERVFNVTAKGYSLAEQTAIIEHQTRDRPRLIAELRSQFRGLRPTGALLNLPLYSWKSIFTTNYDCLIEDCYERRERPAYAYSSNFDFGIKADLTAVQIFKLHGSINQDVVDGHRSRIILTLNDYDLASEFREQLFDRLKSDIAGCQLIVIGHSLADPDIKAIVDRARDLNIKSGGGGRITVVSYTRDQGLASLLESRGLMVCFGGLDDFFASLTNLIVPVPASAVPSGDPLDLHPALRPTTIDVAHQLATAKPDASSMFNGWPASYADVIAGLTFTRTLADEIVSQLATTDRSIAVVLGPSGVGKTTAARQALITLSQSGTLCWEHKLDQTIRVDPWRALAAHLKTKGLVGCLLIDEAHTELSDVNDLIDRLAIDDNRSLKLILISSTNQWHPRAKTPNLHKLARDYALTRVNSIEIDRLLDLAEFEPQVRNLVEQAFAGFSRAERRRRLTQRCDADMFVCLKNIFASDKLDDIILREYATLHIALQEIYKTIAAMESAGVRVHRQLILRFLGIASSSVAAILDGLSDIIHEQTVDEREGIYAWRGRHQVIMKIVADYKFFHDHDRFEFFSRIIEAISPTYDIEIRTIIELCSMDTGISTITDRRKQNELLRKMLSIAPRERVPRHRLIRNLIAMGDYDPAETEIRLFENDFKLDGPAARYKIDLATARAVRTSGLMDEDRIVLLRKAQEIAASAASRFRLNKSVLTAYCEVGLELARLSGNRRAFDLAIAELKEAEGKSGDPDISRRVAWLEARINSIALDGNVEFSSAEIEDD